MKKKMCSLIGTFILLCATALYHIPIVCPAEEAVSAQEPGEPPQALIEESTEEEAAPEKGQPQESQTGEEAAAGEDAANDDELPEEQKEPESGVQDAPEAEPKEGEAEQAEPLALRRLSATEAVVATFAELKEALSQDNGITTIYLWADIKMESGGIAVHTGKADIVIDGVSPEDASGTRHTLSDYPSSNFSDCIAVAEGTRNVTLRNLIIIGRNFNGTVSVPTVVSGVVITYDHVDYTGPQITRNFDGTARYIDTNISISSDNAEFSPYGLAIIRNVELGGTVTIDHTSSASCVFSLRTGAGRVTVLDGANVQIMVESAAMSLIDGYGADFTVGKNAYFSYAAPRSFTQTALTSLTVESGGTFSLSSTGAPMLPILNVNGDINVKQKAMFLIMSGLGSAQPVIRLDGDLLVEKDALFHVLAIGGATAAISVFGGGNLRFEDPSSVILYNKSNTILFNNLPGTLSVKAQQINYWKTTAMFPTAGKLNDPPLYGWHKGDGSNFTISGSVSIGSAGIFTLMNSNYELGDQPAVAPSASSFHVGQSRMLSFGRLKLAADPFREDTTQITGTTAPHADVRANYLGASGEVVLNGQANAQGAYSFTPASPLALDTLIIVQSNKYCLTSMAAVTVDKVPEPGVLEFLSVPGALPFETALLSSNVQLVARPHPEWEIVISDTRGIGNSWKLTARVIQDLTPAASPGLPALPDSLVFVDSAGLKTPLRLGEDTLIRHHVTSSGTEQTMVRWAPDQGVLAEIQPGSAYIYQPYTGIIQWTLSDAP